MKILQPHKISSEILDLIFDAKEYLLIISPYVNLTHWKQLESALIDARKKNIRIDFFVRNEPDNVKSWEQIENLGIVPRLINNLHAKFYLNEKNGVISSMNLLSSSNSNSIEIGCKLENLEELEELKLFVKNFLIPNEIKIKPSEDDLYYIKEKFADILGGSISNRLNKHSKVYFKSGQIIVNAPFGQLNLQVDKVQNKVFVTGILSGLEADELEKSIPKYIKSLYLDFAVFRGANGVYDIIQASSKVRLTSSNLDALRMHEKKGLIAGITEFIYDLAAFKKQIYSQKYSSN